MISNKKIEFGDFQTPEILSDQVCDVLLGLGIKPTSLIEPTCGKGNFFFSALKKFPNVKNAVCNEINSEYVGEITSNPLFKKHKKIIDLKNDDFFKIDWASVTDKIKEPITFIGNPPWVTNSKLGSIKGLNLPAKTNFQGLRGFDALTGSSNFDISEWMLIAMVNILKEKKGSLAMLVKTSVARKALAFIWKNGFSLSRSSIYHIDSASHFGVSVDACLFFCEFSHNEKTNFDTKVFLSLDSKKPEKIIGYRNGQVIADVDAYKRVVSITGSNEGYVWRSGVKHDCSKVMELKRVNGKYLNGMGEIVDIEEEYVYPMMKSSDLANHRKSSRWMIVTQKKVGQDTSEIKNKAPKTWKYLNAHSEYLNSRGSSIYKKVIPFSVFGIGDYTFTDWKVAVSGFYKNIQFRLVGKQNNKPVVFDDTCYFIPCSTKKEAESIVKMLSSSIGKDLVEAFVFWDAKRPVTSQLLNKIDIKKILTL